MSAFIFDTETTGTTEPEVIEAAWLRLRDPQSLEVIEEFERRYRPSKPIQLGALATHHILDEELVLCEPSTTFQLPADVQYLIGHNVDFDWKVIGQPDVKRICTLALARRVWPDADSHSQAALLYLIESDRARARNQLRAAHSAAADVLICRRILAAIIAALGDVSSWRDLWLHSEAARIPRVMPFGKHKGMPIADLPPDYKAWLLRQPDLDPYLAAALRGGAA